MSEMKKPVRVSLVKQVLSEMERCIAEDRWPLGSRIPPEPELTALFGVSRNTVREAVQTLIHNGILQARPGDGTYVTACDAFEVVAHKFLQKSKINHVHEARTALGKEIVRLAAVKHTDKDLREMKDWLDKCEADAAADMNFHISVAKATHNPILLELYSVIAQYLHIEIANYHKDNFYSAADQALHVALYEAIRGSDPDEAEKAAVDLINGRSMKTDQNACDGHKGSD